MLLASGMEVTSMNFGVVRPEVGEWERWLAIFVTHCCSYPRRTMMLVTPVWETAAHGVDIPSTGIEFRATLVSAQKGASGPRKGQKSTLH